MDNQSGLVVLGPPLCGKGTQAELIEKEFGFHVISTGQIFRDAISEGSELGRIVEEIVYAGKLVPDDVVFHALQPCLDSLQDRKGLVLDGFPRTIGQAKFLEKLVLKTRIKIMMVILLEIDKNTTFKRSAGRNRIDDKSPEVLETRWKLYREETEPVLDYYRKKCLLSEINGIGSIPDVWKRVLTEIRKRMGIR